ncbi:MAG: homogentisate 1,2-dioxygenase, partial [Blastococcus sp.]
KRHTQFRQPDGRLYAEELMSQEGFSFSTSLLYHRESPTAIVKAEAVDEPVGADRAEPNHPLQPRLLHTHGLPAGGDLVGGRQLLLVNEDVRLSYAAGGSPSELYRNGVGDELVYVESGRAVLESVYGRLEVGQGDYVVVPTSTTHRWLPQGEVRALVVESRGHVGPPARYFTKYGQLKEGAPYCERDIHAPEEPLVVDDGEAQVLVRTRAGLTRFTYAHHPFDVVGWDGYVYPYRFSIHDFEPITGRIHQPPPVHQTFEAPGVVVCSFVPRLFDYDPLAVAVPYNHANVDSDEMLFYVGGDYSARKGTGIGVGSISLHPSGFTHGPAPGAVEAALGIERTDELAVMVDTFRPLHLGPAALDCEDPGYAWTWAGRRTQP